MKIESHPGRRVIHLDYPSRPPREHVDVAALVDTIDGQKVLNGGVSIIHRPSNGKSIILNAREVIALKDALDYVTDPTRWPTTDDDTAEKDAADDDPVHVTAAEAASKRLDAILTKDAQTR